MIETTGIGGISGVAAVLWIAAACVALYLLVQIKSVRFFLGTASVILIAAAFCIQTGLLAIPDFYVQTSGAAQILLAFGSVPMLLAVLLCAKYRGQNRIETAALSSSINPVAVADLDGTLQYVNQAFERLVGARKDDRLIGQPIDAFFDDQEQGRRIIETVREQGDWRGEIKARLHGRTASEIAVSFSLANDIDGNSVSIIGSFVDLTSNRARDRELKLRRDLIANIVENVPVVLWTADMNGKVSEACGRCRPSVSRNTGLPALQPGASVFLVFDGADGLRQGITQALSGEQARFTWTDPAGATFESHIGPRLNGGGKITGVIGVSLDVSSRVEAERALQDNLARQRDMEHQLERAQRLEAVGRLTGGVAHDFNNLLTTILGNIDLLSEQLETQPGMRRFTDSAARAAGRGADLTRRLLAFSRQQTLTPSPTNLRTAVENLTGMLDRTVPESIAIETDFDAAPAVAMVDPAQLESALLNLALNARDAMPAGGVLRISTSGAWHNASALNGTTPHTNGGTVSPGGFVRVTVSDTGTGMSPDVVERAFEPFFTTKEISSDGLGTTGSGLGLSMVYGFVTQSQGHIYIDSTPGNGTVVTLLLPAAQANDVVPDRVADAYEAPAEGSGTIMVVEDDPDVRAFIVHALERLGYKVVAAQDGIEALDMADHAGIIDLLVTDVVLPGGLPGPAVADRFLDRFPNTKILFTSGYVAEDINLQTRHDIAFDLLQKPYTLHVLADKIHAVMNKSAVTPLSPKSAQSLPIDISA